MLARERLPAARSRCTPSRTTPPPRPRRPLLLSGPVPPQRRPGEEDAEQDQHHDRPDVDEHLGDGRRTQREQDVLRGHTGEDQDRYSAACTMFRLVTTRTAATTIVMAITANVMCSATHRGWAKHQRAPS